ncbi:MAG: hypothetical protein EBV06_18210 [Planctomycetia bacterium]|nr:hypothetical protein [Planctomycetia bacterium]
MRKPGDPFVPRGDHDEFRIEFERVIPLLLKIESAPDGSDRGILFPPIETAAARFAGETPGNVYSRYTNPSVRAFEPRYGTTKHFGLLYRQMVYHFLAVFAFSH